MFMNVHGTLYARVGQHRLSRPHEVDMNVCIHPKGTEGPGTFPEMGKGTSNPLELSTQLPQDKSKELIVQSSDFSLDVRFALYISLLRFKYSGLCASRLFCSRQYSLLFSFQRCTACLLFAIYKLTADFSSSIQMFREKRLVKLEQNI